MRMKCVDSMMSRLFKGIWRGKGIGDVAPEEAIAIGCASFAYTMLQSTPRNNIDHTGSGDTKKLESLVEEDVFVSPIGIGLSLQEGDPAAIVMIEKNTPLPALVTKNVSLTGCTSSLGVVQILDEHEKNIGKIEGIDVSAPSLEITMELSCGGQLSVLVDGGPESIIS